MRSCAPSWLSYFQQRTSAQLRARFDSKPLPQVEVEPKWNYPSNWHSRDGHTLRGRKHHWGEESDIPANFRVPLWSGFTCASVDDLAKDPEVTRRCLYKWLTKLGLAEPDEESLRLSPHASAQKMDPSAQALTHREGGGGGFSERHLQKVGSTPTQQRL
jgi:hypothetical protein